MATGLGALLVSSAALTATMPGPNHATIVIVSGTYGSNCGAPRGNVTRDLAQHCDGLQTCRYPVSIVAARSGGCRNDYLAEWRCGRREFHSAALAAARAQLRAFAGPGTLNHAIAHTIRAAHAAAPLAPA